MSPWCLAVDPHQNVKTWNQPPLTNNVPSGSNASRDVASGERVKRFARNEFLGDLSFEFDAMGTVPGHGFHSLKAQQSWSIPNLQDVHR